LAESSARLHLRRHLEAHLTSLGYSSARMKRPGSPVPEVVRVSPVRGRIVYGETVLRADLRRKECHERLLFFSQRRTRHRSSILLFIGVAEADAAQLDALLEQLDIRSSTRGGHVHIVPVPANSTPKKRTTTAREERD
jgi:hypothetical protein